MTDREIYIKNVETIGLEKFTNFCVEQFHCPQVIEYELCKYLNDTGSCFECWKDYIEKKIAPCKEPNN